MQVNLHNNVMQMVIPMTSLSFSYVRRYYQSFHGKDFKALAECAPFILWEELDDDHRAMWLSLSKVLNGAI